jgi:uncharacterized protein (DUF1697 family)
MTTPIRYVALLRGINMIGRKVVPMTELTFLTTSPGMDLRLPFASPKREFKIVGAGPREVFSVRYALGGGRLGDSVGFIEKKFGQPTTSRNYTTVVKLAALR